MWSTYVFKEDDKLWELDHITDVVVDSLIINTADTNGDSSSDTDKEGIELLSGSN